MGYTHYWSQYRDISREDWQQVSTNIAAILNDVQHVQGIPLADGMGNAGTSPMFERNSIAFNGVGEASHETFAIRHKRGKGWDGKQYTGDCTKTARKPYDVAVTACLAYLCSVYPDTFGASSDGDGRDWLAGVELARRVLPRFANVIDIPLDVRRADRWDYLGGHVQMRSCKYDLRFCVDGFWYAFEVKNEANCYRFETTDEVKKFVNKHVEPIHRVDTSWRRDCRDVFEGGKSIFDAWGCFDKKRTARLARLQTRALSELIRKAPIFGRNIRPPLFARPNVMPRVPLEQATLADLFNLVA